MEVKEKIEALEKLKVNFIKFDEDVGLCLVLTLSMSVSSEFELASRLCLNEFDFIDNLFIETEKRRKIFYFYSGIKTKNSNLHFWLPKNRQARINWINREIKKLKKC